MARFVNPQLLEVILAGPGSTNRLFIFTGIADIDMHAHDDDQRLHNLITLNLSEVHNHIRFNPSPKATAIAGVALPASMKATDKADQVTWAVDQTSSEISNQGELLTKILVALQGNGGALSRVAYEVFVQTTSLKISDISVTPADITLRNQPVLLGISVFLAAPAFPGGETVALSADSAGVSLPSSITIAENQTLATITGLVIPSPAFPPGSRTTVNITAANATSRVTRSIFVHA